MATQYLGVNVGGSKPQDVTLATSTNSTHVELVVDDTAAGLSRATLLAAIDAIKQHVSMGDYPL